MSNNKQETAVPEEFKALISHLVREVGDMLGDKMEKNNKDLADAVGTQVTAAVTTAVTTALKEYDKEKNGWGAKATVVGLNAIGTVAGLLLFGFAGSLLGKGNAEGSPEQVGGEVHDFSSVKASNRKLG